MKVILGDCLEEMPKLTEKVDMILCDLPYGTTACKWDTPIPFKPLWEQYKRLIKPNGAIVLFGSQPFTSALMMSNPKWFKYCWVWEKDNASNFFSAKFQPLNTTEDIIIFSNGGCNNGAKNPLEYNPQNTRRVNRKLTNHKGVGGKIGEAHKTSMKEGQEYIQTVTEYPEKIIKFARDKTTLHPTQKPVALCEYLIRTYTNEGDLVLDNCAGSGTTGVACLNTNRDFILIEKEKEYYDIILKRLKETPPRLL